MSPVNSAVMAQSTPREATASRMSTGSISGRVTMGGDGAPGVVIALLPPMRRFPRTVVARATTDEDGRFRLMNIAAGRYSVLPLAPTFVVASGNSGPEPGKTVVLDESEAVDGVNFTMTRGGVITGRVTDTEGRPVIAEMVRLELLDERGRQLPLPSPFIFDSRFQTDDRGIYRFYGLPAGRYRVSVGQGKGDDESVRMVTGGRRPYTRTFHPNASKEADAKIVELGAGAEAASIDITLGPLAEAFKASGRIIDGESGQPLAGISFGYGTTDREQRYLTSGSGSGSRSNQKGEFRIENLAPGYYAAFIFPVGESSEWYGESASFEIVDADVSGLELKLRRGASLSGVAVIEGISDRAVLSKLQGLHIYAQVEKQEQGLRVGAPVSRIAADGSFQLKGIPPGRAFIRNNSFTSQGLSVLRVERDGVVQNNGIEVAAGEQITGVRLVIAYGTGVVRGRVVTASGATPEGMQMRVSARRADATGTRQGFEQQPVEVDERGRFLLEGLTSGEYELTLHVFPRLSPGNDTPPPSRPVQPIVQRIVVASGTQVEATFTLNTGAENQENER